MSDVKIPFVCGSCFHWERAEVAGPVTIGQPERGVCYGAPPALAVRFDRHTGQVSGQGNLRPATLATERACGAFTPAGAVTGAANDGKVN
jgi:hypothetical protein